MFCHVTKAEHTIIFAQQLYHPAGKVKILDGKTFVIFTFLMVSVNKIPHQHVFLATQKNIAV